MITQEQALDALTDFYEQQGDEIKQNDAGCISWNNKAYPTWAYAGITLPLYKWALIVQLPSGYEVGSRVVARHTCDNNECFNIDHLIKGTIASNNKDKVYGC